MPTYCFRCPECGTGREIACPVSQRNKKMVCGFCLQKGTTVRLERDYLVEQKQVAVPPPGAYPYKSSALGVHASQASELREVIHKAGIDAKVFNDGDVQVTSRSQRKQLCELRGLHDRNAGYSDRAKPAVPHGQAWFEGE